MQTTEKVFSDYFNNKPEKKEFSRYLNVSYKKKDRNQLAKTPDEFYSALHKIFNFDFDPCPEVSNEQE